MGEFEIGDVVQLKSGGPEMTIRGIGDYSGVGLQEAFCEWFDGKEIKSAEFNVQSLSKYED